MSDKSERTPQMVHRKNNSVYMARMAGAQLTKEARRAHAASKLGGVEN